MGGRTIGVIAALLFLCAPALAHAACVPANSPPNSVGCHTQATSLAPTDYFELWQPENFPDALRIGTAGQMMEFLTGQVTVDAAGATCNGTGDDTSALNAYLATMNGGTLVIPAGRTCVVNSANLSIPAGVSLEGTGGFAGQMGVAGIATPPPSVILLNPAHSVVMGQAAKLRNVAIERTGLTANPTDAQAIAAVAQWGIEPSKAIQIPPSVGGGVRIEHVFIEGFNWALWAQTGAFIASDIVADTFNGAYVTNAADNTLLEDVRFEPFYSISSSNIASAGHTYPLNANQSGANASLQFAAGTIGSVQVGDYAAIQTGARAGDITIGTTVQSVNNATGVVTLSASTAATLQSGDDIEIGGAWARPGAAFYFQGNDTGLRVERPFGFMYRTGLVIDGVSSIDVGGSDFEWQPALDPDTSGYGTVGYRILGPAGDTVVRDAFVGGYSCEYCDETSTSPTVLDNDFAGLADQNYPSIQTPTGVYLGGQSNAPITITVGGAPVAGNTASITITSASLPSGSLTFLYTVQAGDTPASIATWFEMQMNMSLAMAGAHFYAEMLNSTEFEFAGQAPRYPTATLSTTGGITLSQGSGSPMPGSIGQITGLHLTTLGGAIITAGANVQSWHIANLFFPGTGLFSGWANIDSSDRELITWDGLPYPVTQNTNVSPSSCFVSNSSHDNGGRIQENAGGSGCTITFQSPWPVVPNCWVQNVGGSVVPVPGVASETSFSWSNATLGTGQWFVFGCSPN